MISNERVIPISYISVAFCVLLYIYQDDHNIDGIFHRHINEF